MTKRTLALSMLAALSLSGCGSHERHSVVAPPPPMPSPVVGVQPPPRSLHIAEDAATWVKFATPLDSTTVDTRSVFLKLDYARLPIDVAYRAVDTTIRIVPHDYLRAGQTYTIEITPAVQGRDGAILSSAFLSQFTTRGVRRPRVSFPTSGMLDESPFVTLSWDSTDTSAGDIRYDVYAGADSAQVAARSGAPLATVVQPYLLPRASWGTAARLYWAITARNLTTNESAEGAVWVFATVRADAPVDSVVVPLANSGWFESRELNPTPRCNLDYFSSGPTQTCVIQWALGGLPADLRLERATMRMPTSTLGAGSGQARVWGTTQPWTPCVLGFPGPPYADQAIGVLAQGYTSPEGLAFSADRLTAHLEAQIRRGTFPGYLMTSQAQILYQYKEVPMRLVLRYYRR